MELVEREQPLAHLTEHLRQTAAGHGRAAVRPGGGVRQIGGRLAVGASVIASGAHLVQTGAGCAPWDGIRTTAY